MSALTDGVWPLAGPLLLIFLARMLDVSLGTIRIVFISRGLRKLAPLIGFFEILVWLLAIGQVVQNLDQPIHYIAYAGGYATGTWIGMRLEERLALGFCTVRIITGEDARGLMEVLGRGQFGVTSFAARGLKGRVRLILTVIRRRELGRLLEMVRKEWPKAFVSVTDVRLASEGFLPGSTYPRLGEWLRKK